MKRFLALLLCIVIVLTGCTQKPESDSIIPQTTPEAEPTETTEIPQDDIVTEPIEFESTEILSVAVPAFTETFSLDDGTELFSYTAQNMQLLLPDEEIADKVILNFLNRIDSAHIDAESVLKAAQSDYDQNSNWLPYFYQVIYSPSRIDRGVLSLSGTQNIYSGGTHGALSCVSVNYDLTTGDILTLGSIMHMDATKEQFIQIIIEKLASQAEELQLFAGFEDGVYQRLGGDENLYEDFFFTTTGLNFYFAPYEIAPYAAGVINVEIPYQELTGLIYDGYFPAEREDVQGRLTSAAFMDTDMEQFNSMAEVVLTSGESTVVVYPNGKVEDIRIVTPGDGMRIPEYTVFAALEMSPNNAVVLMLSQEEVEALSVAYLSNGNIQHIKLAE